MADLAHRDYILSSSHAGVLGTHQQMRGEVVKQHHPEGGLSHGSAAAIFLLSQLIVACSSLWGSGAACVAVASVVFSLSALFVKLTDGRVPTFEIVCFRSSLSFLACAFGAYKADISPLWGHRPNLGWLVGRGMCGALAMTSYYLSIGALPLADAVTLFFLNPAMTAVAAWALLHEPLGWLGMSGAGLSVVGLVILSQPPFLFNAGGVGWDHQRVLGTSFGLLSAVFAAGAFICIRVIGKSEPALVMSVYFHSAAFITSVLPLAVGFPDKAVMPSWLDFTLLVGVAATSFWGQIFIGRGFQLLAAAKASAINFTQVIYSYAFGIILLHETISWWGVLGSALIAGGVLLVNMRRQPKEIPMQVALTEAGVNAQKVSDSEPLQEDQPLLGSPGKKLADSTDLEAGTAADMLVQTGPDAGVVGHTSRDAAMKHEDVRQQHQEGMLSAGAAPGDVKGTEPVAEQTAPATAATDADAVLKTEQSSSINIGLPNNGAVGARTQRPLSGLRLGVPASSSGADSPWSRHIDTTSSLGAVPEDVELRDTEWLKKPLEGEVDEGGPKALVCIEPFLASPGHSSALTVSLEELRSLPQGNSISTDADLDRGTGTQAAQQQQEVGKQGSWHVFARMLGHMDSRIVAHGLDRSFSEAQGNKDMQ